MPTGIGLITSERNRQISQKGWTVDHDVEQHSKEQELLQAASGYLDHAITRGWVYEEEAPDKYRSGDDKPFWWPEDWEWKPKSPLIDLIRAGALIAAEIDRRLAVTKESDAD